VSSCSPDLRGPLVAVASPTLPHTDLGYRAPMVITALTSLVCVSVSTLDDADPVPPWHGVTHALVVVGPATPVSNDAPVSPSSPFSFASIMAPVGLVEQTLLAISKDELCSLSVLDDERLSPKVLLLIAYEVVS
jgi:hypothetical protein